MSDFRSITAGVAAAALLACAGAALGSPNLVGFNFTTSGSATPDPQNWTRISQPDGTVFNVPDETGAPSGVNMSWGGGPTGGFVYLGTSTLAPDAVPQYDYDLSGMTGYGFRSNGEFFLHFTGLQPSTPYEYWFVAYRGSTTIDNLVSVSDGDTIDATTFRQFISSGDNNGRFLVNTENAFNTMHWNDLSFVTDSSSTGEITFNWFGDTQTTVIGAVAIRVIPSPASLALLGMGGLLAVRRRR